jgi:hypothetical protein
VNELHVKEELSLHLSVIKFAGGTPKWVGRVAARLLGKVTLAFTVPLTGTDAPVSAGLLTATEPVMPTLPVTGNGVFATVTGALPVAVAFFCGTTNTKELRTTRPRVTARALANRFIVDLLV